MAGQAASWHMLAEFLTWLMTPAPWLARQLGYLRESVAIAARYRRCRAAWEPHLTNTREAILAFSKQQSKRRTLVVLGSGHGLDLPLAALANDWQQIVLVDLVHPWSIRRQAWRWRHVQLATWDIAGVVEALAAYPDRLPSPAPDWPLPADCDGLISLNVMAQLPIVSLAYLHRRGWPEEALKAWARAVVAAHWACLVAVGVPTLLITDVAAKWRSLKSGDADGQKGGFHGPSELESSICSEEETLFGFTLPLAPQRVWTWTIAPFGELAPGIERQLTVVAVAVHGAQHTTLT